MGMNETQTAHLNRILEDVTREITEKYIIGAKEHQSTLSEDFTVLQLIEFSMDEVKDLYTYLHTLREKLRENYNERS